MRTLSRTYLFYLLTCVTLYAQAPLDALRNQVMRKTLFLSNFSADPTINVTWDGNGASYTEPLFHAFMAAKITGVSQRGSTLTFDGDRFSIVQSTKTHQLMPTSSVSPMKIVVHLARPDAPLDGLSASLFYSSLQQAISAVPSNMGDVIPGWAPDEKKYATCTGCTPLFPQSKEEPRHAGESGPWAAPKLLRSSDPEFPAGTPAVAGTVLVAIIVSDHGDPQSIWIIESMGADYDASAAKAVAKYRFKPATKNGVPTPVRLNVEVNFIPDRRRQ